MLSLSVKEAKEYGAQYIYPAFGMTLRDRQRTYYYNKLDELFPELKPKYEKRFGMSIQFENTVPTLEEYIFLRSAVGWNMLSEKAMAKGIAASTYSVVAKSEGLTVGMGRIVSDGGIIFLLADVIVIPDFQGKGIGKEIMNRIMNWIKTNSVTGSLIWLFALIAFLISNSSIASDSVSIKSLNNVPISS